MAYRVVQWATGSVGRVALREILKNPEFELAGVKVYGAGKAGKDAGELCDMPRTGVKAVEHQKDLGLRQGDCVVYCPRVPDYDEIVGLLRAGVNVVTTASNVYPQFYGAGIYDKLNKAGIDGNATFHGSGINPAFISDVLSITLSGVVHRASSISVREISDVNHYATTAPEIMLDHIGFGKTPEEATKADGFLKGMTDYFSESIAAICDHLGVKLERVEGHHPVAVTKERIVLGDRVVEAGTVGCRNFTWTGIVGGKPRIFLSTFWKLTANLDPPWEVSSSKLVEWIIGVEGTPSVECKVAISDSFDRSNPNFHGHAEEAAVAATATHAVNAIPYVCDAPGGVKTFLDLPIIASRGAFRD